MTMDITNQTENLWRPIRKYGQGRNIIRQTNMKGFLVEFTRKYKYISPRTKESIINAFSSIIKKKELISLFVLKYLLSAFD